MSKLEVKVVKVRKKAKHPNADRLTIYNIGGYNCISNVKEDGSDRYEVGDYVVYIPADSLLPEYLLKMMGFWNEEKQTGTLCGPKGNRVKPCKLRGIFSEGLLLPVYKSLQDYDEGLVPVGSLEELADSVGYIVKDYFSGMVNVATVSEGADVAEFLGIEKYEEPIPVGLSGEVFSIGKMRPSYDIESIQKYPDVLFESEPVEFTEKIHGTQTAIVFSKEMTSQAAFGEDHNVFIFSKGLGDKGLAIKNSASNSGNAYGRAFVKANIEKKVKASALWQDPNTTQLVVFGETYGVQDLKYGLGSGEVDFRMFDVYVVSRSVVDDIEERYLNVEECKRFAEETGIKRVPSLYTGPFNYDVLAQYTSGNTQVAKVNQIREGVVIRPLKERYVDTLGRVILKSVSEAYKLRKGNVTEFN